jgi:hypothetical protein
MIDGDMANIFSELISKGTKEELSKASEEASAEPEKTGDALIDALNVSSSYLRKHEKGKLAKVATLLDIAKEEILSLRGQYKEATEKTRNVDDMVDNLFDPAKTEAGSVTAKPYEGDSVDGALPAETHEANEVSPDVGEPFVKQEFTDGVHVFTGGGYSHEESPAYKDFASKLSKY